MVVSVSFKSSEFVDSEDEESVSRENSLAPFADLRPFLILNEVSMSRQKCLLTYAEVTLAVLVRSITRIDTIPVNSPPVMKPSHLLEECLAAGNVHCLPEM